MTDLHTLQTESEKAARDLATAQAKAAAAQARAERAQAVAQAAIDARMKDHARKTLDSFEADETDHRAAIDRARTAFETAAVSSDSQTEIRDLYIAWHARVSDLYMLYRGLANACGHLGLTTYQDRAIPTLSERLQPSSFSAALDTAFARAVSNYTADLEDAWHARVTALMNGEAA